MKLWKNISPVMWPVLGVVILLTLMIVTTTMVWKSNGPPQRKVAQKKSDSADKLPSKPLFDDLSAPATIEKKAPALPSATKPNMSVPKFTSVLEPPSQAKPTRDENFPISTADRFPLGLDGYCPVTLVQQRKWQKGDSRFSANHQSRTFYFVSFQQQQQFLADASRYSPVATGNDVVIEKETNRQAVGSRSHGVFYQDRIYLFTGESTLKTFLANPNRYIQRVVLQSDREQVSLEAVKDSAGYLNVAPQNALLEEDCCCCRPCRRRLFGRRCR